MIIRIICIGKIKEKFFTDAIKEYTKRLSRFSNIEIIELDDEKIPDNASKAVEENIKRIEAEKILSKVSKKEYVIALDLKGIELTSEQFAQKLSDITVDGYSSINFIIGGSLGLHSDVLEKSNMKLTFSKLTFPHQLFRVMLLEQIYRCFKINQNESYHK